MQAGLLVGVEAEGTPHLLVVLAEAGGAGGHWGLGPHEAGEGRLLAHRAEDRVVDGH